jgi:hypothetical protein
LAHSQRLTIPTLELAVGPYEAASVRLFAPFPVEVTYTYEPGYDAVHTLPNGDPGEPGLDSSFEFDSVITLMPLVLLSCDGLLKMEMAVGFDLLPHLSPSELEELEELTFEARDEDIAQDRIDFMPRPRAFLLGGRL